MTEKKEAEVFETLSKPFPLDSHKIRVMSVTRSGKGVPGVYIDARDVMNRLDEAVGPINWTNEYRPLVTEPGYWAVECTLVVSLPNGQRVYHTDVGEGVKSEREQELGMHPAKDAYSDALKRAAVHFGVGRYLYGLTLNNGFPLPVNRYYQFTDDSMQKLRNELAQLLGDSQPAPKPKPQAKQSETPAPKSAPKLSKDVLINLPYGELLPKLATLHQRESAGDKADSFWENCIEFHRNSKAYGKDEFGPMSVKQYNYLRSLIAQRYNDSYGDHFSIPFLTALCGEPIGGLTPEGEWIGNLEPNQEYIGVLPGWKLRKLLEYIKDQEEPYIFFLDDIAIQVASELDRAANNTTGQIEGEEVVF